MDSNEHFEIEYSYAGVTWYPMVDYQTNQTYVFSTSENAQTFIDWTRSKKSTVSTVGRQLRIIKIVSSHEVIRYV